MADQPNTDLTGGGDPTVRNYEQSGPPHPSCDPPNIPKQEEIGGGKMKKKWWRRFYNKATKPMGLYTAGLLLVAGLQWWVTNAQLAEMRQQTDAMRQQLAEMRTGSADERRALVQLTTKGPTDIKELSAECQISNIGKKLARTLTLTIVFQIVKSDKAPDLSYGRPHNTSRMGVLFPGTTYDFSATAFRNGIPAPQITETEREQLTTGTSYIAIYGRVTYVDDFGEHWTQFCWWKGFLKGTIYSAGQCIEYNQADTAPRKSTEGAQPPM
jgi:hypothetical protein